MVTIPSNLPGAQGLECTRRQIETGPGGWSPNICGNDSQWTSTAARYSDAKSSSVGRALSARPPAAHATDLFAADFHSFQDAAVHSNNTRQQRASTSSTARCAAELSAGLSDRASVSTVKQGEIQ
jgi:hypothetical protein